MPCKVCSKRLRWKQDHLWHSDALYFSKKYKKEFKGKQLSRKTQVKTASCCKYIYYKDWEFHFIGKSIYDN